MTDDLGLPVDSTSWKQSAPEASVLSECFRCVCPLEKYLTELLGPDFNSRPVVVDAGAYELLTATFVAWNDPEEPKRLNIYPAMTDMQEVIDRAQARLFIAKGTSHMITAGYYLARDNDRRKSKCGVVNKWNNTIVTALQAPEWELLLERIGVDAMIHLLTRTSLFTSLPNGCLCQLTGEPLHIHLLNNPSSKGPQIMPAQKRPSGPDFTRPPPNKRHKLEVESINGKQSISHKLTRPKPADVSFGRSKIFYARPNLVPHTTRIIVGLPSTHVFNHLRPSLERKSQDALIKYANEDPRVTALNANRLITHIFPRQLPFFGVQLPHRPSRKTPQRIKHLLPLMDQMLHRHGKCGYKPLRDLACPSKVQAASGTEKLDKTVVLEMMSEQSIILSQMPLKDLSSVGDISQRSIDPQTKPKPRFAEFAISHNEVFRYAVLVSDAVIPFAFWGNKANFKVAMKHVETFITCRRFETLTLHRIIQGFSTSACDWLMPHSDGALKQERVSVCDSLKRRELLEEFLFWYFDGFLMPLLRTSFYITESSAFRNQTLYFRHDDWEILCRPLIERLSETTFEKMTKAEAEEVLRQRDLGFSFVRLLPKDTGVRPIVNLRRKKLKGPGGQPQSINQILQAAFQILTYEKHSHPDLLGASVFGPDEIYKGLKPFKTKLLQKHNGKMPKLYFVKLDVQACFDTIDQGKLLRILQDLISQDAYKIQRYGQVYSTAGSIKRNFVKKAHPETENLHFLKYAKDLAAVLRNTILIDQVVYPIAEKQKILNLLEQHITENIVKIGPDYYRQIVGIPQGSILSSILCSFFYGDLERRFGSFTAEETSAMLRLIDDYLYITTDLAQARKFLDLMSKGHPEYGCFISKEKTLTNFDNGIQILNVVDPQQRGFPWCGFLIDMTDLSISVDYSRYQGLQLSNALTVERGRRSGAAFNYKMLLLSKTRSHAIYTDTNFNNERAVYTNIYQNFLLSAMKMHTYLCIWSPGSKINLKYVHETVRRMIHFSFAAMRNKLSARVARTNGAESTITKPAVIWLGNHAFRSVLSRYPQRYALIIKALTFDISRPRYRGLKRQFRHLVKDSWNNGLDNIII